ITLIPPGTKSKKHSRSYIDPAVRAAGHPPVAVNRFGRRGLYCLAMETAEANPNDRPVSEPSEGAGEKAEGETVAGSSSNPVAARGRGPLAVLRHREFALFWAGQAVSLVGSWMQGFAQGWVVTNLTKEAFALG